MNCKEVEGDKKDLSLQINFTTFIKASTQCLPPHFQWIILISPELGKRVWGRRWERVELHKDKENIASTIKGKREIKTSEEKFRLGQVWVSRKVSFIYM